MDFTVTADKAIGTLFPEAGRVHRLCPKASIDCIGMKGRAGCVRNFQLKPMNVSSAVT
jgi:hypothetical protein